MRYILEYSDDSCVEISVSRGSYCNKRFGDWSKSVRMYRCIGIIEDNEFSEFDPQGQYFFSLSRNKDIHVTRHYNTFEEFMGDYLELFL